MIPHVKDETSDPGLHLPLPNGPVLMFGKDINTFIKMDQSFETGLNILLDKE